MKKLSSITAALLVIALSGSLSVAHAAAIYTEGFTTNSTVMSSNPAPPTATSTDYALMSAKDATGSSVGGTLDLTIPGTSAGFTEMQALFTNTPVILAEGETIRLKMTFKGSFLMDGGDSYGSPGSQTINFGLYNSGGSYPVPGGGMANGGMGTGTNFVTGYVQDWQGYVGRIGNPNGNSSSIYTREPQTDTTDENQDLLFNNVGTGAFDTPVGTALGGGTTLLLEDGTDYTMILDITKTGGVMRIDQYLYEGAGTGGAVLYSASGTDSSFNYDTFDSLAFGYRGRAAFPDGEIHMDISVLEVSMVDLNVPSVTGLGDQTVNASSSITLTPIITGATPLSIQWSSNSVALAGETNATLSLNNIQQAQDGTVYTVVASNSYGTASDSMTLTVTAPSIPTGLYNIQLNYGDGSSTYTGAAQIGNTNDVWNNPVWDGVGASVTNLFSEYLLDTGEGNSILATLSAPFNDGLDWNSGIFNHYGSRTDGSANPVFMEKVVKVNSSSPMTLSLSGLPTNTACSVYLYGSGNKLESGFTCSLDAANTNGGVSSATIMYDTNSVYAATGRDVTLATSQGLSWEVLTGTTDSSGDLVITIVSPGIGNAKNQIFLTGAQVWLDLPVTSPTEAPMIHSISVAGSDVTLSWTDEGIGTYTIQRKTNLTDAVWNDVLPGLPAGLGATNVTASGADQEFYQIKGE